MKKLNMIRLERDEGLREFRYHIKGLVEATETVIELVANLNDAYERDANTFATTSSRLEVEALDHLGYHVMKLRKPLRRLQRDAYARLDSSENREPPPRLTPSRKKAK